MSHLDAVLSFPHTPICHVRQGPRPKLQAFRFCDRQRRCRIEHWSDAAFPAAPAEEQTRGDDQVLCQPVACVRFTETGSVPLKYWRCGNHRVIACREELSDLMVCSVFRRHRDWSVLELGKLVEERRPRRPLTRVYDCWDDMLQCHGQSSRVVPRLTSAPFEHLFTGVPRRNGFLSSNPWRTY